MGQPLDSSLPFKYQNNIRPMFEDKLAMTWYGGAASTIAMGAAMYDVNGPIMGLASGMALKGAFWTKKAADIIKVKKGLTVNTLDFKKMEEINQLRGSKEDDNEDKESDRIYMGEGFIWEQEQAQWAYDLSGMSSDLKELSLPPYLSFLVSKKERAETRKLGGAPWMNSIKEASPQFFSQDTMGLHSLVVGTTGSGKTRMIELIISQMIHGKGGRNPPIILLDPKGDQEIVDRIRKELKRIGQEDKFYYFHPAHPSKCCRLDPVANYNRATEIASRIAALLPSEGSSASFMAFSWRAINIIVNGMIYVGRKPSLHTIKQYIEGGADAMLEEVLETFFNNTMSSDWELRVSKDAKVPRLDRLNAFYEDLVAKGEVSNEETVESLQNMVLHNREHFGKMIAVLLPILSMLTSGDLNGLLSPDYSDMEDERPIANMKEVINSGGILYVGLDSLSDTVVGSAIGSILLADAAAIAGERYNYGKGNQDFVNLFVDEASELVNNSLIQIANKGRGSGVRTVVCTQSISDFVVRMGSMDHAKQFFANLNNLFVLRSIDGGTQEYCTESFPKTIIKTMQHQINSSTSTDSHIGIWSGGVGERMQEVESELVQPNLLGRLPNLEYFARLADGRIIKAKIPIITD